MEKFDVVIIGAGHNGLAAAVLLARRGLRVKLLEGKPVAGGATRTEKPFRAAPGLAISSGAYLLGLAQPEVLAELGVKLPLKRRDPHYFLPTTDGRYLLFGSDREAMKRQFVQFFSESDWAANEKLTTEIAALREDIAPTWREEPLSIEETAEKYVRAPLRKIFVELCRGAVGLYLERFGFKSDLIKAMYAVTDGFSGLNAGYDDAGTGMNFLVHNMCRLPGSDGTWMIVEGGMGTVATMLRAEAEKHGATVETDAEVVGLTYEGGAAAGVRLASGREIGARAVVCNADPFRMRAIAGADRFPKAWNDRLDGMARDGSTFKVNLCMRALPKFTCLPEDRGQFGPTIHLLPDEKIVIDELRRAYRDVREGRLARFPSIEWYFHTPIDPTLRDGTGRHNSALFVQWAPYKLASGDWEVERDKYARHLLDICDTFAPGTSGLVEEFQALGPADIEKYFGITRGHIHHIDNSYGFSDRIAHKTPVDGLYSCSAGTHPAGSVIGSAGYICAKRVLKDLGI